MCYFLIDHRDFTLSTALVRFQSGFVPTSPILDLLEFQQLHSNIFVVYRSYLETQSSLLDAHVLSFRTLTVFKEGDFTTSCNRPE